MLLASVKVMRPLCLINHETKCANGVAGGETAYIQIEIKSTKLLVPKLLEIEKVSKFEGKFLHF